MVSFLIPALLIAFLIIASGSALIFLLRKQKEQQKQIDAYKAKEALMESEFQSLMNIVDQRTRELEDQRTLTFQASKMAALGEMAGGIAHEINNPLTVIIATVRKIKLHLSRNELDPIVLEKACENIDAKSLRISKIIEGLKVVSRDNQHGPITTFKLLDIFEDVLSLCEEKFKMHGIDLQIEFNDDIFQTYIIGHRSQLTQVLWNLLENAYEAISALSSKWIKVEGQRKDHTLYLKITDSGEGIPQSMRDKIFQPLYTTKEIGHGTGLGLSLSQAIMKNHHGDLSLDENSSHTCFIVTLPLDLN